MVKVEGSGFGTDEGYRREKNGRELDERSGSHQSLWNVNKPKYLLPLLQVVIHVDL